MKPKSQMTPSVHRPVANPQAPSPFHRNGNNVYPSFPSHNHWASLLLSLEFVRNNTASTCERILIKLTFRRCGLDTVWSGYCHLKGTSDPKHPDLERDHCCFSFLSGEPVRISNLYGGI